MDTEYYSLDSSDTECQTQYIHHNMQHMPPVANIIQQYSNTTSLTSKHPLGHKWHTLAKIKMIMCNEITHDS